MQKDHSESEEEGLARERTKDSDQSFPSFAFSLQPGPSTPLDPGIGPPPFDQALLNGNRMTVFSHPLLKAFHVHNK